jgi:DNA-directed RNA polymerase subunit M/transcription elongation factor TFIIS
MSEILFLNKLDKLTFENDQLGENSIQANIEKLKTTIQNKRCSNEELFYFWYDSIQYLKTGISFKKVIDNIDNLENIYCESYLIERDLKDQLIENPPKMKDGIAKCPKCGEKKTIITETQGRSCDEGFTYELHCYNDKCSLTKTKNFSME